MIRTSGFYGHISRLCMNIFEDENDLAQEHSKFLLTLMKLYMLLTLLQDPLISKLHNRVKRTNLKTRMFLKVYNIIYCECCMLCKLNFPNGILSRIHWMWMFLRINVKTWHKWLKFRFCLTHSPITCAYAILKTRGS